jgi:transcriptional regulator with XRE-family HTH domain
MEVESDFTKKGHYMPSGCLRRATPVSYSDLTFIEEIKSMRIGERIRELRLKMGWRLRDLAERVGVGHTHLSRIENKRLNYGEYPSVSMIHRLAAAFDVDEDELLLLSKRIPEAVKKRVLERPDAFRTFAECDDATLDKLLNEIGPKQSTDARAAR